MSEHAVGEHPSADPVELWVYHELSHGRSVSLRVRGRSMYPWLRDGQRVLIRPIKPQDARLGLVVLSWRSHAPSGERLSALHRVVWLSSSSLWTKGDALPRLDDPAPRALLIGEAYGLCPLAREQAGEGAQAREWVTRAQVALCFGPLRSIMLGVSFGLGLALLIKDRALALRS